jgi:sensor c-di-GMP phosphodiesterase-like protein
MFMLKWGSISNWGRGEPGATARAVLACDWILESAIAHEQIEVQFQPQIEPRTGRVTGAEALARSSIAGSAGELFARASAAGLEERLSRFVQKKALRSAAVWEGPLKGLKLSLNLLPQEISRSGYDQWLLDEIGAVGIDPSRITVEITETARIARGLGLRPLPGIPRRRRAHPGGIDPIRRHRGDSSRLSFPSSFWAGDCRASSIVLRSGAEVTNA